MTFGQGKKTGMNQENRPLPLEPIFASDEDWHCNARLNWSDDALELYVLGYKEAADSLVAQVIQTGRHQDSLVFPICFLYRQYIELRLKEVIRSGRQLLDEPGAFPQHHKIQHLWDCALAILKKVFAEDPEPPDFLSIASHVVAEFSKLDPDSFTFRYPLDKQGANPLEAVTHINLRRVAEYVDAFAEVMDAGSMALSVYLNHKSEMASYYGDY
jgi:hypothetical protein